MLPKVYRLLFAFYVFLTVLPSLVYAACERGTETELGICLKHNPIEFVKQLYGAGLGLIGGLGVLYIIYGGYLILSSSGDPTKVNRGKHFIQYAVIGIVLAISGYTLYQVVARDVLKLPGF